MPMPQFSVMFHSARRKLFEAEKHLLQDLGRFEGVVLL